MLGAFFATVASVLVSATNIINTVFVAVKAIQIVANTLVAICKELGLIEDKSLDVEELGAKVLAAEEKGITPEKFDTYEQFVKEIEKFEVNSKKAESWNQEEKTKRGSMLATGLLLEKYGPIVSDVIIELSKRPNFFTRERVKVYLDLASSKEIDINQIFRYLNGEVKNISELKYINNLLLNIESEINPGLTDQEKQQLINEQKNIS
jgi:hypothetical protein